MVRNNIKHYREIYGYSQKKLAEAVGVARETILRAELGYQNISLKLAFDICEVLETKIEDMFYIE